MKNWWVKKIVLSGRNFLEKALKLIGYKIWWKRKLIILEHKMKPRGEEEKQHFSDLSSRSFTSPEGVSLIKEYFPKETHLFLERLETPGVDGWAFFKNDTPIGYLWVATKSYYEPTLRFPIFLAPKECYLFDGRVYPEFRQGSTSSYITRTTWEKLIDDGFTTSIVLVELHNRRALLAHYLLGYKERFQQVVGPLLFGRPLKPTVQSYTTPKFSRSALIRRRK